MSARRDWVKLYTSILTSRSFRRMSDAAKCVFLVGLAEAGSGDLEGAISAVPEDVADMAALDGGAAAAEAAVAELVASGLLELVDDTTLAYPGWSEHQPVWADREEKAKTGAASGNKRWHLAGKHTDKPKADCPLCEAGEPAAPAQKVVQASAPEQPAAAPAELDAKTVKSNLWNGIDGALEEDTLAGAPVLHTYLDMADNVTEAAPRYTHVKGITEPVLLNLVISHAAQHLFGSADKPVKTATERELHGLRRDHGTKKLLSLMTEHADKDNPTRYIAAILKREGNQ